MQTQKKDAIINRLLLNTLFSFFLSISLWVVYNGYLNTSYVLAMPKIMIAIFIISLVVAAIFYWRGISKKNLMNEVFPYIMTSTILSVCSIAIYFYVFYAIYALWMSIAACLLITFTYNLFKLNIK